MSDFNSFRWDDSGFERFLGDELMDVVSNSQRTFFGKARDGAYGESEYFLLHQDGSREDLRPLKMPSDTAQERLFVDEDGVPFVAWVREKKLTIRKWNGGEWEVLVPTDALLGSLPPEFSWHVFEQEGQVLMRQFSDCRWRGLSASDRGGGVSNSMEGVHNSISSRALRWQEGQVCVSWQQRRGLDFANLYRCHDL